MRDRDQRARAMHVQGLAVFHQDAQALRLQHPGIAAANRGA